MAVFLYVFLLAATFFLYFCRSYFLRVIDRSLGRVPQGAFALPVLGTIGIDAKRPDLTFRKWATEYGRMFTFFLGDRFCLGVTDMDLIRKMFKDDRFAGRPTKGLLQVTEARVHQGIIFNDGDLWREHRRFSLSALRDFGFGKVAGEECIQKEAAHLLDAFHEKSGLPFNPRLPLANAVSNVIGFMLFGDRVDENDKGFNLFVENVSKNLTEFFGVTVMEAYPWLRHIPPFRRRFQAINARIKETLDIVRGLARDHKKTYDSQSIRDYIDAFYRMQENGAASFTEMQLVLNFGDLYIAGFETTTTFLKWALILMILYPDVQRKIQEELDRVIGQSRLPDYTDKNKLPYTDAVTIEVFRYTNFLPFGVAHRALEDVDFEGYHIPKDTEIWPIFCHVWHDKKIWKDPESFRPERFLENKALSDEVQPFSVGKRACLGEPLARMEVFVFFTSIMQKFTISGKPGALPTMEPVMSSVMGPQNFEIIARPRESSS